MYPYAIIGNCQISALVSEQASVDWYCAPRPDSEPLFGRLLDPAGGHFTLAPPHPGQVAQSYIENTNVLETRFTDPAGNSLAVIDFAPCFEQYGRMYRPTMLIRIVRPLNGAPQVVASCQPVRGWSKQPLQPRRGNSHLDFPGLSDELRLTTTMPLTYLLDGAPVVVTQPLYFAFTWGIPVQDDLPSVCESFLQKTIQHWRYWVKHCSIPSQFQREVIRSALTLKLHCYEETGAILAAITTSLPEEIGGVRNWDYRYCWLRDACFIVSAFYRLGHFAELEGLLLFLLNVLQRDDGQRLHPVYKVDGSLPLPELSLDHWEGYQHSRPVRVGNQAAEHIQNDVYGEVLLTLAPLYFDDRFSYLRSDRYAAIFHRLAAQAYQALTEPDAGLWEQRDGWKVHSFTLLMSWAGLDRYVRLLEEQRISGDLAEATGWRDAAYQALLQAAHQGVITNSASDPSPDASLLLLPGVRFPVTAINRDTVAAIQAQLGAGPDHGELPAFLYRYLRQDDFGRPAHAFLICTYWLVEALARLGEPDQARDILQRSLAAANRLGLCAEHFDPVHRQQTGNFPQCYSHVGLINGAFAVSPPWADIL